MAISLLMLGSAGGDQRRDLRLGRLDAADRQRNSCCPNYFNRLSIASILAFALVPVCWYVLYKTPFGLRLRAAGENPAAADAAGVNVIRLRYIAVIYLGRTGGCGRSISFDRPIFALYKLDDGRPRIHRSRGADPRQMEAGPGLFACLFFGFTEA